jgi:peptidoglycan/LPS O-acetylase OafA/YrhL
MRAEYEKNGSVNLRHFWLRRILRIFPSFYLVLFLALTITFVRGKWSLLEWPAIAAQLFHYTNYWIIQHGYQGGPPDCGTGVYWSLAVEEHFYLLFPWLYIGMRRFKLTGMGQGILLLVFCLLVLSWRYILFTYFSATGDRIYMGTDTRFDSILFGCVTAIICNPVIDDLSLHESRWKKIIIPFAFALLFLSLCIRSSQYRETLRYSMQGIVLAPIFVAAIRFPQWTVFRPLNWRYVKFLGLLSYSFYLVHYGVIFLLLPVLHASAFVGGVVAFTVSCVISYAIYKFVEKPISKLRRRFVD